MPGAFGLVSLGLSFPKLVLGLLCNTLAKTQHGHSHFAVWFVCSVCTYMYIHAWSKGQPIYMYLVTAPTNTSKNQKFRDRWTVDTIHSLTTMENFLMIL